MIFLNNLPKDTILIIKKFVISKCHKCKREIFDGTRFCWVCNTYNYIFSDIIVHYMLVTVPFSLIYCFFSTTTIMITIWTQGRSF